MPRSIVEEPEDEFEPTWPIEEIPGGLAYRIYGQDGQLVRLTCKDTMHNRNFIVWLRKFDRAGKVTPFPPKPTTP